VHHHHAALPMGGDLVLLFGASLLGSAHCVGMCGPYVAMCTAQFVPRCATPVARFLLRILFNLGRISTYALIGLIVGAFGQIVQAVATRLGLTGIVAITAGIAAVAFGLSMIGWLRDPARVVAGAALGRWLIACRMRLYRAPSAAAPLLLGALQGWLPCTLVYAAASRAGIAGSAGMGALTMVVFGLGTVPAIFALTIVPQTVLRRVKAQRLAGVLLTILGVLLMLRGFASFGLVPSTGWW
jgi:sulfite exporter TauE/SafE